MCRRTPNSQLHPAALGKRCQVFKLWRSTSSELSPMPALPSTKPWSQQKQNLCPSYKKTQQPKEANLNIPTAPTSSQGTTKPTITIQVLARQMEQMMNQMALMAQQIKLFQTNNGE